MSANNAVLLICVHPHACCVVQVWSELDPQATHFIPAIQLSTLIQELLPPLGAKGEEGARTKVQAIIMAADIPVRNGKVGRSHSG